MNISTSRVPEDEGIEEAKDMIRNLHSQRVLLQKMLDKDKPIIPKSILREKIALLTKKLEALSLKANGKKTQKASGVITRADVNQMASEIESFDLRVKQFGKQIAKFNNQKLNSSLESIDKLLDVFNKTLDHYRRNPVGFSRERLNVEANVLNDIYERLRKMYLKVFTQLETLRLNVGQGNLKKKSKK